MKDWERIREARTDLTDYAIHWTKGRVLEGKWKSPFEALLDIVECGYLKPSFSIMTSIYGGSPRPTIKGPHPAVCFTEQTLDNFMRSCKALPSRYYPYGIALHKWPLYQYGGRPVISGSEEILGTLLMPAEPRYEPDKDIYRNGLPEDHQYLWVRYQPIPNQDWNVVDWTHEREWRCKINTYHDDKLGSTPTEGVPLLLPSVYNHKHGKPEYFLPKILVGTREEKTTVNEVIKELLQGWTKACQTNYLKKYFELLPKVNVVALSELAENPDATKLDWIILEKTDNKAD